MKIAVLSSFPPRKCGVAYPVQNLFASLRDKGHELVTFGMEDSDCQHKADISGVRGLLKILPVLEREGIRHVSIQFIIGLWGKRNLGLNMVLLLWALRRRKIRAIVTLHEVHYLASPRQAFARPAILYHILLEILIARLAAGVIVYTKGQERLLRRYGVRNARAVTFGIRTPDVPRTRTRFGKALFFGKLGPIKGVHLFPAIARACPEVHFTLAASVEPKFEAYRRECERLLEGIPNVTWLCQDWFGDEEKDRLFAEADVLVLPYVKNPYQYQSGAVSESGVHNIPVVVTDQGALTEAPAAFGNGIVLKSPEPAAFKEAIGTVFRDYPKYLEGIRRYRAAANWGKVAEAYLALLEGGPAAP